MFFSFQKGCSFSLFGRKKRFLGLFQKGADSVTFGDKFFSCDFHSFSREWANWNIRNNTIVTWWTDDWDGVPETFFFFFFFETKYVNPSFLLLAQFKSPLSIPYSPVD